MIKMTFLTVGYEPLFSPCHGGVAARLADRLQCAVPALAAQAWR